MIQNPKKLEALNRELTRTENVSYLESLAIFEALHRQAVSLGVINSDNMLEGIEVDIRIANAINKVGLCTKR